MRTLVDFINHGTLPFVGRQEELDALVAFWRGTSEAQRLRVGLLHGEAGIGKSRLVEELVGRIVRAGGVAVHAKFYPESTVGIAPSVARALRLAAGARGLLPAAMDETLPSVLQALQRLARLRPSILIIEDLHLLSGDLLDGRALPLRELATLLGGLADETVALLCVARPLDAGLRGLLEPSLVREVALTGLEESDFIELWRGLFGGEPAGETIAPLRRATLGNPLALRSVLRGAINAGTIARRGPTEQWGVSVPAETFERRLQQSVAMLSEGMTVHLGPEEREAASKIATLGEIVARESALRLLDGESRHLDALVFKGILVPTDASAPPIGSAASRHPLYVFTHTLVHRHFVGDGADSSAPLVPVLADDEAPLYSILPFQLVAAHPPGDDIRLEVVRSAITRSLATAFALDDGADWRRAVEAWSCARALVTAVGAQLDPAARDELEGQLLGYRLGLLWRDPHGAEYRELVERLLEHSAGATEGPRLRQRLLALLYLHRLSWRSDPERALVAHGEMESLVGAHPDLRLTWTWLDHLHDVAHAAWANQDLSLLRTMEGELDEFERLPQATDEQRRYLRNGILRYLVTLFDSHEELERRRQMLAEIDASGGGGDPIVTLQRLTLLESTGEIDAARTLARAALPQLREQGLKIESAYCSVAAIVAEMLIEGRSGEGIDAFAALCASLPEEITVRLRGSGGERIAKAALLLGDIDAARTATERFLGDRERLPAPLAAHLSGAMGVPASPLLRLDDLLLTLASLDGNAARVLPALLDWLSERRLSEPLAAILDRHGADLPAKELSRWRKRIGEIRASRRSVDGAGAARRAMLSMLGTIELRREGAEPVHFRGARLRAVLGTMAGDALLSVPLTGARFAAIAAGDEDPENARRILNVTVHRLRESLGADMIVTGGDTPRLNGELVEVDLVEGMTRLRAAREACRRGALVRALPLMREAIEILRGEVPFPTLYDSFFEALREDIENEQREAIVAIAAELLREGDGESAEELLAYAARSMPGDDEIARLRAAALTAIGRTAEAIAADRGDTP